MPKSSKKTEQSSSYRSADSGPTTHKTKLDGPPKNTKKKKDGGGTNKKQKLSKKELKELEKQQRQKSYIAPTKPQPIKPDPLDSTGLAYVLPGELVIVLRNLGKKAVKTREKALDDLESGWVNSDRTKESSGQEHILIDMLPVWLSHLPQLLLHASRRIRLTATNIHRSLVNMPTILEHIKLQLEADGSESADVIGVWALASQDIDPAVASSASESWRKFVGASLSKAKILTYAQRAIVDPGALYAYLNPSPLRTPAPIPHDKLTGNQKTQIHSKGAKGKTTPVKGKSAPSTPKTSTGNPDAKQLQGFDDPPLDSLETDTDRDARLRVSGLGALAWVLSASSYLAETLDILSDARLWSSLAGYDFASFGFEQPPVRRAAWRLVGTVNGALGNFKSFVTAATQSSPSTDEKISTLLRILSFSVFHSAWTEQDASVQGVMWQPLLRFLKDNPKAWQWEMGYKYTASIHLRMKDVDAGSDSGLDSDSESNSSDDEDEDVRKETEVPHSAASRAFKSFLSFLACGCNGSPIQSYPAVMVILSTIPSNILLASYSSESIPSPTMPFTDLFSSFWAAVEPNHHPSLSPSGISVTTPIITRNRIFSGSGADKASKAFVEAVLDCLTFLVRRTVSQSQNATSKTAADILGLSTLIRTQIKRVWVEVVGTAGATTTVGANGDPLARKLVLRISPDVLGTSLARMLRGLRGIPEGPFYDDAWETVTRLIQDSAIEVSSASTSIAVKDLSSFTSGMLKALQPSSVDSTDSTHSDAQQLLVTVFNIALDGCERSVTGLNGSVIKGIGGLHLLTKLISTFDSETGTAAASDGVTIRIDTFVVQNAYKVLSLEGKEGLELLATYLLCRDPHPTFRPTESSQAALTWLALLEQVVEHFHSQSGSQKAAFPVVLSYLLTLLDSLKSKRGGKVMVVKLRPIMNELDDMILEFAQDTVASGLSTLSSKLNLVRDVLLLTHRAKIAETISHPLLVPASLVKLVGMLVARFEDGLESLLGVVTEGRDQRGNQEEEKVSDSLDRMDQLLVLMEVILQLPPVNVDSEQSKPGPSSSYTASLPALPSTSVIPGIFLLAYALPRSSLSPQSELASTEDGTISHSRDNLCAKAQRIWESSIKFNKDVYSGAKDQPYHEIYSSVTQSLRTLLSKTNLTCSYWCTAEDVVEVFEVLRNSMPLKRVFPNSVDLEKNPINALLPSQESLDALLDGISGAPISRSLGVVDELAGAASTFDPSSFAATSDINDVRIYARYALALLHILSSDLGLAKRLFTASSGSWWALRHLFVLGVYARGIVSVPNAPNALYRNPLYHLSVLESERVHRCREIIGKVHRIVAYVFASAEIAEGATAGEGREWRKDVCRMLPAPDEASPALPFLAAFLFSIVRFAAKTDSYRDCCVLREVLSRLFQTGLGSGGRSEISEEEANLWLNYARRLSEPEKGESARAPLTGVTIMSTLVANLPSSSSSSPTLAAIFSFPHLERYRNELASSLLGVSPSRATSDGLRILLRLVLGTAPDIQSEAEFLPVQRAVNVIKACQKWIEEGGDDDDASGEEGEQIAETGDEMEELESAMTLTFYHLAPILQNVAGGHWQFIFDVVENNIENCDFNFNKSFSASTSSLQLITLARTIRLVGHIQDLAATNKSLRAEWSERKGGIMKGVRRMILLDKDTAEEESEASKRESDDRVKTLDGPRSVPESICRELVLELVANYLPDELMDYQMFPQMCHLLSSSTYSYVPYPSTHSHSSSSSLSSFASSIHHDQLAYQILYKATKKRTEYFVLEAGVDTEGKVKAQLPEELLVLLQQSVDLDIDVENADIDGDREHEIFVYLLSWMLFFDSFVDTSMKVRMSYIEQLRSSSIIETHFIPSVLNLLNLGRGIVKAYKLDIWAVDEFYVQFYEAGSFSGLQTFAAHLYYRALLTVPSLIYSWVVDCRDRQLSSTIASYTQSHFSPVLIRAELEHVKGPEAQSEFASESDENQLTVKVASGAVNEVTASYLVDEQQLEIRLRIPGDWPLHRIEIRDTKKVGVDDNRWRAWILGVQQTIWAQNGRILDGLALFKKNVAGHFQGQVECAICYSLISVMDGSLPKKPCNTCKNRFHAGCLFKWFNSSHSSSCPLCRSDILH